MSGKEDIMEGFVEVEDFQGTIHYVSKENVWRFHSYYNDDQQTVIVLNEVENGKNKEIVIEMPIEEFKEKLRSLGLPR